MSNSSIFDDIGSAKASNDSNYVRAGTYEAELGKVELTKNHAKVEFLAIEMTVTKVIDDDDGKGHKEGEDITHLMKVQNTSFLGNFKQFAASALSCDADQVGKKEADRITGDVVPGRRRFGDTAPVGMVVWGNGACRVGAARPDASTTRTPCRSYDYRTGPSRSITQDDS